ncbi:MAG: aminotransferase class V-fold PLP-dependent enzyme, partial [Planctomycetota bacterium]
ISQWLDVRGVAVRAGHHCAMPLHASIGLNASTRASFYFYNTVEEVDVMVSAIQELVTRRNKRAARRRS